MGRKKPKKPPAPKARFGWATAFSLWYAFILFKTLPGSGQIMLEGLMFPLMRHWSGAAISRVNLAGRYLADSIALAAIVGAALGWGLFALTKILRAPTGRLERLCLAQGLGFGILALAQAAALAVKIPPIWSAAGLISAGLALLALAWREYRRAMAREGSSEAPGLFQFSGPLEWGLFGVTAYALFIQLIGSLAPETFYDSLVYHLAIPDLYRLQGRLVPVEGILHANFPQNMGMLYLLGLLIRGEGAAKLLHWWMYASTLAAIYSLGKTACSKRTALTAAALFATLPVVATAVWHTGVALAVSYWTFLGVWAVIRGLFSVSAETAADPSSAPRWLILSGIFSGLAMGAKYSALWPALAIAVVIAVWLRQRPWSAGLKLQLASLWALAAGLCLAPWLIKNTAFTGNPVYPFLSGLFGTPGPEVDVHAFRASARGHFWHGGPLSWKTWLAMPWDLFLKGRSSYSFIGPLLVAFAPLALILKRVRFPFGWLLALFGIQYALWASNSSMVRLLIPALPLFCLYAAHALTELSRASHPGIAWLVLPLVLWNVSWNAAMVNETQAPAVVFGFESRETFLDRNGHGFTHPFHDLARYIEEALPPSAKILVVGDSRRYPVPRRTIATSAFEPSPLLHSLNSSADPAALKAALEARGISHILISHPETFRLLGPRLAALPPEKLKLLDKFWRGALRPLKSNRHKVGLFELREDYQAPPIPRSGNDLSEIARIAMMRGARF